MSLPVRRRIGDGACVSALGAPIRLEIEVVGGLPVHLSRRLRILQRNYIRSWVRRLVCNLAHSGRRSDFCFGSTPAIDNSEANLRKGWKPVIRSSRLNDANAPIADFAGWTAKAPRGASTRVLPPKRGL
jgi:hypothetical protein